MKAEEILFNQIKEHTENWMKKCGYNIPYDYEGLRHVVFETYAKQSELKRNNIIDDWLKENGDPEIQKKVAEQLKKEVGQSNWVSVEEALQLLSEDVDSLTFLDNEEQVERVHIWIKDFMQRLLPEPPKQ